MSTNNIRAGFCAWWSGLFTRLPWGLIIAIVYGCAILALARKIPPPDATLHYTALRGMGTGTRVAEALMLAPHPPHPLTLEDRWRLADEHDRLLKRYLKESVTKDGALLPENVLTWPPLGGGDVVPVALEGEG